MVVGWSLLALGMGQWAAGVTSEGGFLGPHAGHSSSAGRQLSPWESPGIPRVNPELSRSRSRASRTLWGPGHGDTGNHSCRLGPEAFFLLGLHPFLLSETKAEKHLKDVLFLLGPG